MYPYRSRTRWLLAGRYSHLVQAVEHRRAGLQDSELERRLHALRHWNQVRFVVSILLSLGAIAAILSAAAQALPGGLDDRVVGGFVAASTTFTGALTLAYLFLTRLLGQLEIDVLAILTVGH